MFLLDTSILAAVAPNAMTGAVRTAFKAWLVRASDRLYVSVVTVAELERRLAAGGAACDRRTAAGPEAWLDLIKHLYRDRFLPVDLETARLSGRLIDRARRQGGAPSFEDAAIAATASLSGLTIIAASHRHFQLMDVAVVDPCDRLPDL